MDFSRARGLNVFLLICLMTGIGLSQTDSSKGDFANREKLLVLPFEVHGLSNEDGSLLAKRFVADLNEAHRFEVIFHESLQDSESASNPRSLAQTGMSLGVQKVVHVKVVRRDNHYVFEIRLVNVIDASLLYAERVDYSGVFGALLSDVIPEQARKLAQAHLDAKTPWAKAAFLFGACLGAILWILWHLRRGKPMQGSP